MRNDEMKLPIRAFDAEPARGLRRFLNLLNLNDSRWGRGDDKSSEPSKPDTTPNDAEPSKPTVEPVAGSSQLSPDQ